MEEEEVADSVEEVEEEAVAEVVDSAAEAVEEDSTRRKENSCQILHGPQQMRK